MSESESDTFETASGVSVADVRHELGDGETQLWPESTIIYHLGRAESEVAGSARDGASMDQIQGAVALDTAYRIVTRDPDTFAERYTELDVTEAYDVETYVETLKRERDEEVDRVTGTNQPFLATLGGRSRSWSNTRRRRR